MTTTVETQHVAGLEVIFRRGIPPVLCAAHPSDPYTAETLTLLEQASNRSVTCINPSGAGGKSMEEMVDAIESARAKMGFAPWVFWGMSGGGWLAQLYAHRHPHALHAIILESVCASFMDRLTDETCAISPHFRAWQAPLHAAGLHVDASPSTPVPLQTHWREVPGAGSVLVGNTDNALLVSPMPLSAAMKAFMGGALSFDSRPWLPSLKLPVLVLAGDKDPVVPVSKVRALAQAIPRARFVVVEGAGHVPTAEKSAPAHAAVRDFMVNMA